MSALSPLATRPTNEADLARINEALAEAVVTDDRLLTEMASHLIPVGGKRLRPAFVVAAGLAERPDGATPEALTDDFVTGGVAVELVHLGSLYHDDVMDDASTRRGVEAVNARWGNLRAILAGDFLLAKASELAASLGTDVAELLAATIAKLCEGQVRELQLAYDVTRSEPAYMEAIRGKTAELYATSCRIGGLVAGADEAQLDRLDRFGRSYGMAFQIVDDILDLTSTEADMGKPIGNDLREGIYTLPVVRTLAEETPQAAQLAELLASRDTSGQLDDDGQDAARSLVLASGHVESSVATAERFVNEALSTIESLPLTPTCEGMRGAATNLLSSLPSAVS